MTAQPNLNTQITKLQAQLDMADLLELAINRHNLEVVEMERLADYNDQLLAENAAQAETIAAQEELIAQLERRQASAMDAIDRFEPIAKAAVALRHTHDLTKANLAAVQKELNQLKGGENPKKLKEQIKRNKEKNAELTTRNERLLREAKEYRSQLKTQSATIDALKKEVYVSGVKDANGTFTRLWSDGTQHIILWPDAIKMQNTETGDVSEGRALLYMHQSGRGALLTLDDTTGTTQMGASPKGGLKISRQAKDFTDAWLYKVNQVQGGDITDADLRVTDI